MTNLFNLISLWLSDNHSKIRLNQRFIISLLSIVCGVRLFSGVVTTITNGSPISVRRTVVDVLSPKMIKWILLINDERKLIFACSFQLTLVFAYMKRYDRTTLEQRALKSSLYSTQDWPSGDKSNLLILCALGFLAQRYNECILTKLL